MLLEETSVIAFVIHEVFPNATLTQHSAVKYTVSYTLMTMSDWRVINEVTAVLRCGRVAPLVIP